MSLCLRAVVKDVARGARDGESAGRGGVSSGDSGQQAIVGWEGADEGLLRRGRSGRASGGTAAAAEPGASGAHLGLVSQTAPIPVGVVATPIATVHAKPTGEPPTGTAVAYAQPLGLRARAEARAPAAGGMGGGRAWTWMGLKYQEQC